MCYVTLCNNVPLSKFFNSLDLNVGNFFKFASNILKHGGNSWEHKYFGHQEEINGQVDGQNEIVP